MLKIERNLCSEEEMSDLPNTLRCLARKHKRQPISIESDSISLVAERAAAEIERLTAELAAVKTVPMKYRRMTFNAQLQNENERLEAELAAAKAKHYEECAVIAETTPHQYGVNAGGRPWLTKATRNTCADAIRAALTDATPSR